MQTKRILTALLPAVLLALAPAGEAAAKGACVYVTLIRGQKSTQCADGVANQELCDRKSVTGDGKFHPGASCKDLDLAASPRPGPIPPPAKATVDALRPVIEDARHKDRR